MSDPSENATPKPVVVTITGIRPDFIRMSEIFKRFDENFRHILVHTGQHYDALLSDVFFNDLNIRKPDYVLNTGVSCKNHYEQLGYMSIEIPKLLKQLDTRPDWIVFLGDSNSVCASFALKKEGYRICHIEAGMRSGDKRMLEEINRTVCDHCSDLLFVYHEDYKENLARENIRNNVHVCGNTIVEVCDMVACDIKKCISSKSHILVDIHRPENFQNKARLIRILEFANICYDKYNVPVYILYFKRLVDAIETFGIDLGKIKMIPLMPYKEYLQKVYDSIFLISDSGTGQEEPAILGTKVLVPRDFTERPQSYRTNCSYRLDVSSDNTNDQECFEWIADNTKEMDISWLGDGKTSYRICEIMRDHT